jgi:hypothetical protein
MFQVTKTFTFKNGNSSEYIWDILLERRETYLPLLSQEITTQDAVLTKVKTLSIQLANAGKLLTKFTELSGTDVLVIKLNFLDQASWLEYANLLKTEFGYDPSTAIDISECVSELIEFTGDIEANDLTVYIPVL